MSYKELLRELQGEMTQVEFAQKIGITQSALSKFYTDRSVPGRDVIAALVRASPESKDCILDVFFGFDKSDATDISRIIQESPANV